MLSKTAQDMRAALSSALLSIWGLFSVIPSSLASEDCIKPGSTPSEVEECLSNKSASDKKKVLTKFPPLKFPAGFMGTDLGDGSTQIPADEIWKRQIAWGSETGENLLIGSIARCYDMWCGGRLVGEVKIKIPVENIVSYTQVTSGTGSNASEQVQSVAVTAFIVPIIAPFAAAINAKGIEHYTWGVSYLDDYGIERKIGFQTSSTIPVADRFYTFLPTLTGMQNGERKGDEELSAIREKGLLRVDEKLVKLEKLLAVPNTKKPWCIKMNISKLPSIYSEYLETLKQSNQLRKSLNKEDRASLAGIDSESPWQKYLEDNPSTKLWAEANPTAAEKFRKCPTTAN